jgi:hypothetical protein
MRRLRLNGWQRIGIVLSVVWAIVGSLWGLHTLFDPIRQSFSTCASAVTDFSYCSNLFEREMADARQMRLAMIVMFGLAPIPIAWLIVYGLIGLVSWIRRGFGPSPLK